LGTNQIVGSDLGLLRRAAAQILDGDCKTGQIPPLWDGQAGERIAEIIVQARR
jgi:UDP-N-acetylglucosamine 2-epimerase (non-hydrolysing)